MKPTPEGGVVFETLGETAVLYMGTLVLRSKLPPTADLDTVQGIGSVLYFAEKALPDADPMEYRDLLGRSDHQD